MKVKILREVQTIKKPELGRIYEVVEIVPKERGGVMWIVEIDDEYVGLSADEIEILEV